MPPRIPFLAVLRHPAALIRQQAASISTTSPLQAVRRDVPTTTSSLLDIDSPNTAAAASSATRGATQTAIDVYESLEGTVARRRSVEDELRQKNQNDDYMRQMTRRWKVGDVYAPHDLSPAEMAKWRRNQARRKDLVDMLGLRPLDMYRNFSVISEFITPHGRIKRSIETGLRPPNQRKMAKAIRRAIGLGIHPSVHRHPEILVREHQRHLEQNIASIRPSKY
ncbi:ribosomal protein S18 [Hypoxylon sp. FL0543]|nr:ribosomal protein S18 [Hypoxylon sp. FL0543]